MPTPRLSSLCFSLLLASLGGGSLAAQDVAIYRDQGVWKLEQSRTLPAILDWLGYSYTYIDAKAINKGALLKGKAPAYRLLIVPGGWAAYYISKVGGWTGAGPGDDQIRAFVKAGGGYVGFCAGAFAASTTTRWLNRNYAYSWKLFDGTAEGPLYWNPLKWGKLGAVHGKAVLDLNSPELKGRGLPALVRTTLYGGPRFLLRDPKSPPPQYRVLARHGEDKSAAIISFRYPTKLGGRVVLSSFHPSVLLSDGARFDRDEETLALAGAGKDPDGDRPDWLLGAALIDLAIGQAARAAPAMPSVKARLQALAPLRIGQSATLQIDAPPAPNTLYILLASQSRSPGLRLSSSVILPLAPDTMFFLSLSTPTVFQSFIGVLDSKGRAQPKVLLPRLPSLRNLTLDFAGVTFAQGKWLTASNPLGLRIQ